MPANIKKKPPLPHNLTVGGPYFWTALLLDSLGGGMFVTWPRLGKKIKEVFMIFRTCQYIEGEPDQEGKCNKPTKNGSPWCDQHAKDVYERPKAKGAHGKKKIPS